MAITRTDIVGTKIICEIESSNLVKTEYDTDTNKLIATFKSGIMYEYEDVPHKIYAQFRLAESQGKYFNTDIAKQYKYKKIEETE